MFGLAQIADLRRRVLVASYTATADIADADHARRLVREARERGYRFAAGLNKAELAEHYAKQRERADRVMAKARDQMVERCRADMVHVP